MTVHWIVWTWLSILNDREFRKHHLLETSILEHSTTCCCCQAKCVNAQLWVTHVSGGNIWDPVQHTLGQSYLKFKLSHFNIRFKLKLSFSQYAEQLQCLPVHYPSLSVIQAVHMKGVKINQGTLWSNSIIHPDSSRDPMVASNIDCRNNSWGYGIPDSN